MEKKRANEEMHDKSSIVSHVIFNRRTGDIYISLSRRSDIYKRLIAEIAKNGSAKGIRVVIRILDWRIEREGVWHRQS